MPFNYNCCRWPSLRIHRAQELAQRRQLVLLAAVVMRARSG